MTQATREAFSRLQSHIEHHTVGQQALVQGLMLALLCDAHLLLERAPGLAKTQAIKTLADGLEADSTVSNSPRTCCRLYVSYRFWASGGSESVGIEYDRDR